MANNETYPDTATLNNLAGSPDDSTGVPYLDIGEKPHYTDFFRMQWAMLQTMMLANALRAYKSDVGDLYCGVRAGRCTIGTTEISYAGAANIVLTDDAVNYLYIAVDGAVTVNQTGFPIQSVTPHVAIAEIAVGSQSAAAISGEYALEDITDRRSAAMLRVDAGDELTVANVTGGALGKGTLIRLTTWNAANGCPQFEAADADGVKGATHVLTDDVADNATGPAAGRAVVGGQDTSGMSIADPLYVSATAGAFTDTPPTGEDQLVQRIGGVVTVDAADGQVSFWPGDRIVEAIGSSFLQDGSVVEAAIAAASVGLDKLKPQTAYNPAGSQIDAGTPLRITGAQDVAGTIYHTVAKATAASGITACLIAAADIAATSTGTVIAVGTVTGLDTSSWPINTLLYVDYTGGLTNTLPASADEYRQLVAVVTVQNASTGEIFAFAGYGVVTMWGSGNYQAASLTAAAFAASLDLSGKTSFKVPTPTAAAEAATKAYVDAAINGLDWQGSVLDEVDFTTSEPGSPSTTDRYINTATGTSSGTTQSVTATYIYEWNGSTWTEIVPTEGAAVWVEDTDLNKLYLGGAWVGFGTGVDLADVIGDLDDVTDGTTYYRLGAVDSNHEANTGSYKDRSVSAAKLNEAQEEHTFLIHVTDLGVGADISDLPIFSHPRAGQIKSLAIFTEGAAAGVDDSNTVVFQFTDGTNNILSSAKTYNTSNQPPDKAYDDMGTLDATHKNLTAEEVVRIDVTQGATANMPGFYVALVFLPTDAT